MKRTLEEYFCRKVKTMHRQYWNDKELVSWDAYKNMEPVDKVRCFAVEGVTMDELAHIHQALARAIGEGTTRAQFKRECETVFSRIGWLEYDEKWRIDDLYNTQVLTAYSVRRYADAVRGVKYHPYCRYSRVQDIRARPAHRFMDGKIWPVEHPVWDAWWPLNGPSCRCGIRGLTKGQIERQGLTVETEDPTGTVIHPVDENTGEPLSPVVVRPDEGYDYNPGKLYLMGR